MEHHTIAESLPHRKTVSHLPPRANYNPSHSRTLAAFQQGLDQQIPSPLTSTWSLSDLRISSVLAEVGSLSDTWSKTNAPRFSPDMNPAALQTAEALCKMELPMFSNDVLLPGDKMESFPYHHKEYERAAVEAKGSRVGDMNPEGYVCNVTEAHQYGIRAILQHIFASRGGKGGQPLLISSAHAHEGVGIASETLNLEYFPLRSGADFGALTAKALESALEQAQGRPIILVMTLSNKLGGYDDVFGLARVLRAYECRHQIHCFIHIDAHRSFDYLTTLSTIARKSLQMPNLVLGKSKSSTANEFEIAASTIIAGGFNMLPPAHVVILKPSWLGTLGSEIQYVQGRDNTISGSRDGVPGLLVLLQEHRFTPTGMQALYAQASDVRSEIVRTLREAGYYAYAPLYALDIVLGPDRRLTSVVKERYGMQVLSNGNVRFSVHPSVSAIDARDLIHDLTPGTALHISTPIDVNDFIVSPNLICDIRDKVRELRAQSRESAGYPLNASTMSVIGPVVGQIMSKAIPFTWIREQSYALTDALRDRFHVQLHERGLYGGGFTTGSTMANQIGILTARKHFPNGTVYMSRATHYSCRKIVEDGRINHRVIPVDEHGHMSLTEFEKQVREDKELEALKGLKLDIILVNTFGTTFTGAIDPLADLYDIAARNDTPIAYVHADGALNFGALVDDVCLGVPGSGPVSLLGGKRRLVVNGISLSLHKFAGLTPSAQVLCALPPDGMLAAMARCEPDPRAVFEAWLFYKLTRSEDILNMQNHCSETSKYLRDRLKEAQIESVFNEDSWITLIPRPPPWVMHEFNLSPENGWVHFITMPHISRIIVDGFVEVLVEHRGSLARALVSASNTLARAFHLHQDEIALKAIDPADDVTIATVKQFATRRSNQLLPAHLNRCILGGTSFIAERVFDNSILCIFLYEASPDRGLSLQLVLSDPASLPTWNIGEVGRFEELLFNALRQLHRSLVENGVVDEVKDSLPPRNFLRTERRVLAENVVYSPL